MIKILVLHGPNMNFLGIREPEIYGSISLEEVNSRISRKAIEQGVSVTFLQANGEGQLIDFIQEANTYADGIVFNPGGYTHTSISLRDAIKSITIPVVEVHLSNLQARESYRRTSVIAEVCSGCVYGFGWKSYLYGIQALLDIINNE